MTEIEAGSAIMFLCSWGEIEQLLEPSSLFPAGGCLFFFHSPPYVLYCMHGERRQGPIVAAVGTTPNGDRPPAPPCQTGAEAEAEAEAWLVSVAEYPPFPPSDLCEIFALEERGGDISPPLSLPPSLPELLRSSFVRMADGNAITTACHRSQQQEQERERERERESFVRFGWCGDSPTLTSKPTL